METKQISNIHILAFIDEFCEKISRSYNDEIISIVDEAPTGIVNYNNILLLKKAQKFVRHTVAYTVYPRDTVAHKDNPAGFFHLYMRVVVLNLLFNDVADIIGCFAHPEITSLIS